MRAVLRLLATIVIGIGVVEASPSAAQQETPRPAQEEAASPGAAAPAAESSEPLPGAVRVPSPREGGGEAPPLPGAAVVPSPASPIALPPQPAEAPSQAATGDGTAEGESDGSERDRSESEGGESEGGESEAAAPADAAEEDAAAADGPLPARDEASPGEGTGTQEAMEGDAGMVVRAVLLPRAEAFADRALALQNAILRRCHGGGAASRDALGRAFLEAVRAAAALVPGGFGSEAAEGAAARLVTPVADTAFSRSRLVNLVTRRAPPPRTIAALSEEDVALRGLSAIEALLFGAPAANVPLARRCALAGTVAANVRAVALDVVRAWRGEGLADHWRGDEADLAHRLRLRDLVQGMIRGAVRLNRDLTEYIADPGRNPDLPFADGRTMVVYLDALAAALSGQASLVRQLSGQREEAFSLLSAMISALEEGRINLLAEGTGRVDAAVALPFQRVQAAVLSSLPVALGFDLAAFTMPPAAVSAEVN